MGLSTRDESSSRRSSAPRRSTSASSQAQRADAAGTVAGLVSWPRSLAPLRHRRYAALWIGAFASNDGTWMETVGVGILVTSQTGQAGWAGIVAAAAFVPNALFGPLGGALADRLPRRRLILATTT